MKAVCAESCFAMSARIVFARSALEASAASGSNAASTHAIRVTGFTRSPGMLQRARRCGGGVVIELRMPEIIEVEPVVGRLAHIVFQARGIRGDVAVQRGLAIRARQDHV